MTLYRSKPQLVEAIQWTSEPGNGNDCIGFVGTPDGVDYGFICQGVNDSDAQPLAWLRAGKNGAQGWVVVPIGHWIVRKPGDLSDHWPVDPDYFAEKYEPV